MVSFYSISDNILFHIILILAYFGALIYGIVDSAIVLSHKNISQSKLISKIVIIIVCVIGLLFPLIAAILIK